MYVCFTLKFNNLGECEFVLCLARTVLEVFLDFKLQRYSRNNDFPEQKLKTRR